MSQKSGERMRIVFARASIHGKFGLIAAVLAVCASCTTAPQTVMLAPARQQVVSAEAVRLYDQPPKHFQEIALIEGRSVAELRSKAGALGANGLIYGGTVQKPGPVIGVGLGTSSYHFGRHSAYGVETGTSFDIPTGGSVIRATAIYVR